MKKLNPISIIVLVFLTTLMSSCEAITGIFNAGMGVGIFSVIAVIVVIVFLVMKARKNKA